MDETSQQNIQMKEKTARKLEKSFIEETTTVTLLCKVWLWPTVIGVSESESLMWTLGGSVPAWFHFIKHASPKIQAGF